jgi:hypothetical protein
MWVESRGGELEPGGIWERRGKEGASLLPVLSPPLSHTLYLIFHPSLMLPHTPSHTWPQTCIRSGSTF